MDRYNPKAGPTYNRFIDGMKWVALAVAIIASFVIFLISRGS